MNRLNITLSIIIIILIICGYWPSFLLNLIRWLLRGELFTQTLGVGLGVVGGMWADKKLRGYDIARETVGALEILDAELQSNIRAAGLIKEAINKRPSLDIREKLSPDKILEMARSEEKWIGDYSVQLSDRGYYTVLQTISGIRNRKLFEGLVNVYLSIRNVQSALKLETMSGLRGNYSEEAKVNFIKMGDEVFRKNSEYLGILEQRLVTVNGNLVDEEKKILREFNLKSE